MTPLAPFLNDPPTMEERSNIELILKHGHQDLVQAVAFNSYGDRCATGSVDGKIRVFNRHKDGTWRHCDNWSAHGGEILELQWLPPTIYPNLLASLGIEGRFKLWAEDPSAAPGRRFSNAARGSYSFDGGRGGGGSSRSGGVNGGSSGGGGGGGIGGSGSNSTDNQPKAAFETRSNKSPYRSFSMKHVDDTRHTYLALASADGSLTVYENEQPENLADYTQMDEFTVCPRRPARGEETAFRVRFDPNLEVCYTALRAGVPTDALGLVVAAMESVRIYRTRDTVSASLGVATAAREFYLAAEIKGHRGLVRDVAWAPGNIRGYDIIATACQDGLVRVFGLSTPMPTAEDKKRGWSLGELKKGSRRGGGAAGAAAAAAAAAATAAAHPRSGIRAGLDQERTGTDRSASGKPGEIAHVVTEISKLNNHRTPVWRVGFDDDGQILGSVGDEGKLMCFRQTPNGSWAKSSEMAMTRHRMAMP
ncbi:WD40-repeat-containing domain protein [Bombardia bombarda]|uniref:WD40-repeat-containing domain protein n=1 Tax=Bombardia bombarda TaxID=252184 RepID=A0AA39WTZ8_9PEZI|nr:WD40-repeat-containing domain protein [Bombardia bombarda]